MSTLFFKFFLYAVYSVMSFFLFHSRPGEIWIKTVGIKERIM